MKKIEIENVTLYCGDCYEVLYAIPSNVALITDPPYGIGLKTNYKDRGRGNLAECNDFPEVIGDDKPFNPEPFLRFETIALFGANYFADKLSPMASWIVWDKLNGLKGKRETGFCDSADCELIWTNSGKAARIISHRWMGMLKDSEQSERRLHPTQKPVALMEQLIRFLTKEGDTIFDPFMGVGATGIAAARQGYPFIGVEISDHYFEIARKRIEAVVAQSKMF